MLAHVLSLMFEGDELVPLRFFGHGVVVGKERAELVLLKAVKHACGASDVASAKITVKPPGSFFRQVGQAAVAELRDQNRFIAAALGIAIRAVSPLGTRGQLGSGLLPYPYLIRHVVVMEKVFQVDIEV